MTPTTHAGRILRRIRHFGQRRYCPCCYSHVRAFLPNESLSRPDARCPICGSSERERAQVLLLRSKVLPRLARLKKPRILQIAPEAGVEQTLRAIPNVEYESGDIEPGRTSRVIDVTQLEAAPASFDLLFVSRVLERIHDDARAIAEMFRVLKPNGMAFVEVPIHREVTYEDADARSPEQRLKAFGREHRVRICGVDYAARFARAGFEVEALWLEKEFPVEDREQMRLCTELPPEVAARMPPKFERVFNVSWLCTKPRRAR